MSDYAQRIKLISGIAVLLVIVWGFKYPDISSNLFADAITSFMKTIVSILQTAIIG
jgi:hypothetical protein